MTGCEPVAGLGSFFDRLAGLRLIGLTLAVGIAGFAAAHEYTVAVGRGLDRVTVTVEFSSDVRSLYAGSREGRDNFESAATCDGEELERRGRVLNVTGAKCVTYESRLGRRADRGRLSLPGDVRWTTSDQWLWKPRRYRDLAVRFRLPDDVGVSVPWREVDGAFQVSRIGNSGNAVTLFGDLDQRRLQVGDVMIRLAGVDIDMAEVAPWIQTAADDVASVYGRFPIVEPQVVVLPTAGRRPSSHGVHFGHVIRDEGTAIQFFVDPSKTTEEMNTDWTAAHEFSHLMLPYTTRWISEGFASYYQNVLLARRGEYSENEVWRRLTRSFRQAANTRNPPRLRDLGERSFWEMRMLIYWSGAALALMADVELRTHPGEVDSLDALLGRLQACCLPARTSWSGRMLFERFDAIDGSSRLSSLHARFSDSEGMPRALDETLDALGVRVSGNAVWFDDTASLADVRRAIMAPREP